MLKIWEGRSGLWEREENGLRKRVKRGLDFFIYKPLTRVYEGF